MKVSNSSRKIECQRLCWETECLRYAPHDSKDMNLSLRFTFLYFMEKCRTCLFASCLILFLHKKFNSSPNGWSIPRESSCNTVRSMQCRTRHPLALDDVLTTFCVYSPFDCARFIDAAKEQNTSTVNRMCCRNSHKSRASSYTLPAILSPDITLSSWNWFVQYVLTVIQLHGSYLSSTVEFSVICYFLWWSPFENLLLLPLMCEKNRHQPSSILFFSITYTLGPLWHRAWLNHIHLTGRLERLEKRPVRKQEARRRGNTRASGDFLQSTLYALRVAGGA